MKGKTSSNAVLHALHAGALRAVMSALCAVCRSFGAAENKEGIDRKFARLRRGKEVNSVEFVVVFS